MLTMEAIQAWTWLDWTMLLGPSAGLIAGAIWFWRK